MVYEMGVEAAGSLGEHMSHRSTYLCNPPYEIETPVSCTVYAAVTGFKHDVIPHNSLVPRIFPLQLLIGYSICSSEGQGLLNSSRIVIT